MLSRSCTPQSFVSYSSNDDSDIYSDPVTRLATPEYQLPAYFGAVDPKELELPTAPFCPQTFNTIDNVLDPNCMLDDDVFFQDLLNIDQDTRYSLFSPIPTTYFPQFPVMSRTSPPYDGNGATQTSSLTTQLQAATPQHEQQEWLQYGGQQPIAVDTRQNGNLGPDNNTSRPIAMNGADRSDTNMLSGSLLGGMSWGGLSVGSFIKDDMLMSGTSPFNFQSPSFHTSSSYVPKMEANFMKDYACCNIKLDSLHELLEHYEEQHAAVPTQTMGRTPTNMQPYAKIETHRQPSLHQPQPQHPSKGVMQMQAINDLDDLDTMDMDDAVAPAVQPLGGHQYQPQPQFGRQLSQSALNIQNVASAFQNPRTTPPVNDQNTDLSGLGRLPGDLDLSGHSTPRMPQSDDDAHMAVDLGYADFNGTIDEPAKRLLSKQGFGGIRAPAIGGQIAQNSELARRLRDQQIVSGIPVGSDEAKPFKCPVIGCEKAYKNQNGLKYHKQVCPSLCHY